MPRYFFHLVDGVDKLLDPEGVEMSPDAVGRAALLQARDCMAGDVHQGHINLKCRIDVHAEDGSVVKSLPFVDAVEVILPR